MKIFSSAVSGARSACIKIALCVLPFMLASTPASAVSLSMGNVTNPVIAGGTLTGTSNFGLVNSSLAF
ncbi:MAG: hypothetical protein ABIZ09_10115, partial [Rhodoferax sp.]